MLIMMRQCTWNVQASLTSSSLPSFSADSYLFSFPAPSHLSASHLLSEAPVPHVCSSSTAPLQLWGTRSRFPASGKPRFPLWPLWGGFSLSLSLSFSQSRCTTFTQSACARGQHSPWWHGTKLHCTTLLIQWADQGAAYFTHHLCWSEFAVMFG